MRLLLAGFGYRIMHVQRALLERMTGTGWSLRRLADRVLRTAAHFTVSGRRITMTTGGSSEHWRMLARGLATLHGPSIARPPPGADPFPGPGGRKGAEVSPCADNRLGQAGNHSFRTRNTCFRRPKTAPGRPRGGSCQRSISPLPYP